MSAKYVGGVSVKATIWLFITKDTAPSQHSDAQSEDRTHSGPSGGRWSFICTQLIIDNKYQKDKVWITVDYMCKRRGGGSGGLGAECMCLFVPWADVAPDLGVWTNPKCTIASIYQYKKLNLWFMLSSKIYIRIWICQNPEIDVQLRFNLPDLWKQLIKNPFVCFTILTCKRMVCWSCSLEALNVTVGLQWGEHDVH